MEQLNLRVTELEKTISLLVENIKDVNQTIAAAFEKVERNFEKTNEKIENLRGSANMGFENVDMQFRDLKEEIKKINDVTGYEGMYSNALKIVK
ncbi:MAG TPA: hypothetical protein VK541_09910 [Pedobacter sp.]|uniref:hypothetical protein n=1 Tax=Pedobacter sp. TaxID=1411316 RepID=UPI002BE5E09C|nr:hypothetical protein [Pedobacter sp.]HMI02786.1 hypothetical protein [Pedobacter sp.]